MLKWFADRLAETGKDARKDERGFTLIELLVVVIIIGILAAIAIPAYLNQREGARQAVVEADARQAGTAINQCLLEGTQADCDALSDLTALGYNQSEGVTNPQVGTSGSEDITFTIEHAQDSSISATYDSSTGNVT